MEIVIDRRRATDRRVESRKADATFNRDKVPLQHAFCAFAKTFPSPGDLV